MYRFGVCAKRAPISVTAQRLGSSLLDNPEVGNGCQIEADFFMMRTHLALTLVALSSLATVPRSLGTSAASLDVDKPAVGVLSFDNNTGKSDYDHLGKGLSTMMANDLVAVDEIRVVERDRMADILREIDAQQTTRFDSTAAVKVGRLVGAQFIVTGAFIDVDETMRIDTRVIRVETGVIVKKATVTGNKDKFLDLQKKLARQLVKDLDVALTPEGEAKLEKRQNTNGIDDINDMARFSNAISLSDQGNYADAAIKMAPLVAKYPGSVMVKSTYDEISTRVAKSKTDDAKKKINGLIKKKWPPA